MTALSVVVKFPRYVILLRLLTEHLHLFVFLLQIKMKKGIVFAHSYLPTEITEDSKGNNKSPLNIFGTFL